MQSEEVRGGGSGCGNERYQFQKIDRLISIFRILNGTTSRIRNAHESRNNPLKWFAIHSPWMLNAITLLASNDEYDCRYYTRIYIGSYYIWIWITWRQIWERSLMCCCNCIWKPVVAGCGRFNNESTVFLWRVEENLFLGSAINRQESEGEGER